VRKSQSPYLLDSSLCVGAKRRGGERIARGLLHQERCFIPLLGEISCIKKGRKFASKGEGRGDDRLVKGEEKPVFWVLRGGAS